MIDDIRPTNNYEHTCKFFAFQTKKEFEPVDVPGYEGVLYEAIDFLYSACNCGVALKTRVIDRKRYGDES